MNIRVIVLVVAFAALVSYILRPTSPPSEAHQYKNDQYGISFEYPDGYVLTEMETGNGERVQHSITLIRQEDNFPRENSEGPTAITIDVYQNDLDEQPLLDWLMNSSASNFKLSNGVYETSLVSGQEAVRYRWSGLYEGETVAFLHQDTILALSVTFITPQDNNREVFEAILSSISLY